MTFKVFEQAHFKIFKFQVCSLKTQISQFHQKRRLLTKAIEIY